MSGKYAPNADYYAELARQAIAEAKAKRELQAERDRHRKEHPDQYDADGCYIGKGEQ